MNVLLLSCLIGGAVLGAVVGSVFGSPLKGVGIGSALGLVAWRVIRPEAKPR
jgi:hypothetical protein